MNQSLILATIRRVWLFSCGVKRKLSSALANGWRKSSSGRIARKLAALCGALATVCGFIAIGWSVHLVLSLPAPDLNKAVQIYDRKDQLLCAVYDNERVVEPVPLKQMSKWLPESIVTSEDRTFYRHRGLSLKGIFRAISVNVAERRYVQGGSTITQQLAKNTFFRDDEKTLTRKVKDALMALFLEQKYSKNEILESYLNTCYFGTGAYGVERAAKTYFGKTASSLTLAEASYLAVLVNAPSRLSKPNGQLDALTRQRQLIADMLASGKITSREADAALKQKLNLRTKPYQAPYAFYLAEVLNELRGGPAKDLLFKAGLSVYTHMDAKAQQLASTRLSSGIKASPRGLREGALVSLSVPDGGVLAIVGGADAARSQWNRALSPHMAGSAFKPFVYLAGLVAGKIGPDSIILDAPITQVDHGYANYNPQNFDGRYLGWITTRKAIALSRNTCAVRVANAVTPAEVVRTAQKAGISSAMKPNQSLALGSCSVSPLELANAYSTLARGGIAVDPQLLRRIEHADGRLLHKFDSKRQRVFDAEPVAQLVDALQDVVEVGTGGRARLEGRAVAGKTGTTDGPTDIWFVGFTTDVVTAVWGGNDEFKPISGANVTGGTVMARIWQDYMSAYYQIHPTPAVEFPKPRHPLIDQESPHYYYEVPSFPQRLLDEARASAPLSPLIVNSTRPDQAAGSRPKFLRRIWNFIKSL